MVILNRYDEVDFDSLVDLCKADQEPNYHHKYLLFSSVIMHKDDVQAAQPNE